MRSINARHGLVDTPTTPSPGYKWVNQAGAKIETETEVTTVEVIDVHRAFLKKTLFERKTPSSRPPGSSFLQSSWQTKKEREQNSSGKDQPWKRLYRPFPIMGTATNGKNDVQKSEGKERWS